jgi:fumarate reductase iron-sulfur subunit
MAEREIDIEVLRYHPERDREPYYQSFQVPFSDDTSVLQALQYIKDHLDGSLTFRWSCRMAVCGSCGKMVNGIPHLSCKTFVRDYHPGKLRVEPLAHFPIERDLAVDQSDFLRKLESIKPYLIPKKEKSLAEGTYLQTPQQLAAYKQFSQCINCLLCYAACPQYGLNDTFTGPAVLALLHRYNADSRDGAKQQRMQLVNAEEGVWGCTLVGYCSEVCPKQVDPAAAVNRNKVNSTIDYFLRFLSPRGDVT